MTGQFVLSPVHVHPLSASEGEMCPEPEGVVWLVGIGKVLRPGVKREGGIEW